MRHRVVPHNNEFETIIGPTGKGPKDTALLYMHWFNTDTDEFAALRSQIYRDFNINVDMISTILGYKSVRDMVDSGPTEYALSTAKALTGPHGHTIYEAMKAKHKWKF